jgi:hypothetical protein
VQRKQDSDNREILRGFGFDDNVLENMSSSALDASVKESVPLEMTGDAIQDASQNITQNRLNNSDFVTSDDMQEQMKKQDSEGNFLDAPQGRLQRKGSENLRTEDGQQEFDYQFGSNSPKELDQLTALTKMLSSRSPIEESTIDEEGNPINDESDDPLFREDPDINLTLRKPTQNASTVEGINVGTGTARKREHSEVFRDSIEQLTSLQAGRIEKSPLIAKLQAAGIAKDKVIIDNENAIAAARAPFHTSASTPRGTVRGFTSKDKNEFTETTRINSKGEEVPVFVPPTETITTTNLKKATAKSLDMHQGNIDKNVQLLRDYTVLQKGLSSDMFRDIDRLKQWAIKNLDGTMLSPNYTKFPKTAEGRKYAKTLVFMQKVRVLFNRNRKHDTGVAFSPKELEDLNKTHLNVTEYGPLHIEATIGGKLFDINGDLDLDQNFMKNFNNSRSLHELNKLQIEYAKDAKPFSLAPSQSEEEAISNFNNYTIKAR